MVVVSGADWCVTNEKLKRITGNQTIQKKMQAPSQNSKNACKQLNYFQ
jgi:hypothetical protein